MTTMRAMQISKAGGSFESVERPVPRPGPRELRIRVEACGMCHSDAFVKTGQFPGLRLPRIPGHEVAGRVDALGAEVTGWKAGQRVGVGWFGGNCGQCAACRRGDLMNCAAGKITGISFDGGYAEYLVAPAEAVARIPDELEPAQAGPLLCAGITTYNALRNSGARPGDTVAVQGIGGLGHLAIQYAAIAGGRVIAVDVVDEKLELAEELGAEFVVNASRQDPVEFIRELGGADQAIALAVSPASFEQAYGSLRRGGTLVFVALPAENHIQLPIFETVLNGITVVGSIVGTRVDLREVFELHAAGKTRVIRETRSFAEVNEAIAEVEAGRVPARIVFTPEVSG